MTLISVIQSDYGYLLSFTLQNSDGTVYALTGSTSLNFRAQKTGTGFGTGSVKINGAMTVVSASAGTCTYTVAQGDFDQPGIYNAQIQVNFAASTVTFDSIQVECIPKIPY